MPLTADMSLRELLILQARKRRFTDLYEKGLLPFHNYMQEHEQCVNCKRQPIQATRIVRDEENKPVRQLYTSLSLRAIELDEGLFCENCFCQLWTYITSNEVEVLSYIPAPEYDNLPAIELTSDGEPLDEEFCL